MNESHRELGNYSPIKVSPRKGENFQERVKRMGLGPNRRGRGGYRNPSHEIYNMLRD